MNPQIAKCYVVTLLRIRESDTSGYTQAEIELWEKIKACQETVFHTKKGLECPGNQYIHAALLSSSAHFYTVNDPLNDTVHAVFFIWWNAAASCHC